MVTKVERGTIVWDMDDTLCHFMEPVLRELYRVLGVYIDPATITTSMWLNDMLTKEQFDAFIPYVFNPSFYAELTPTAILANRWSPEFNALHEAFDFHVVTARRLALERRALPLTGDWLHKYAPAAMDGVTITHPDQPKSQVMPGNTIAVVDDSVKVVLDVAEKGVRAFLIDRPWNHHLDVEQHPRIYRVTHENVLAHMARVLLRERPAG